MNILRPTRFRDLIGQDQLLESLDISVKSANKRRDALGHCLFSGPPGLGKTTLSEALANELGVHIQYANGANLRSISSLMPYFENAEYRSIIFIDEIHRMTNLVEEFLYPVMEDFKMDMSNGKEVISVDIPKFTIVGATTEVGSLAAPLRDRFKLKFTLELYDELSLSVLIEKNCKKLKAKMNDDAIFALATASRGTPRIANGLLEWIRDYQIAKSIGRISVSDLEHALGMRGVHLDGSTSNDRKYYEFLKNQEKPVGLETIASSTNIDKETIVNVIEPFLLQRNQIIRTSKGRMVS